MFEDTYPDLFPVRPLRSFSWIFTDGKERGRAFGLYSAIAGGGSAVGLLLGGVLTEYLTWRLCLYVNLALAVPAAAAGLVRVVGAVSFRTGGVTLVAAQAMPRVRLSRTAAARRLYIIRSP